MVRVWEGGYIVKNWDIWDSNNCSQYKSVQILIITVYRMGWGGRRLFIPSCFSLPNCHQLHYPSALEVQPLQPLLPPPLSDFTMACLFPGTPFCLHPTTCTPVWLHEQVPHNFTIILSMIWMRGSSAPSVSLQMTPSWVGVSICSRIGTLCRWICTDWIDGPRPIVWCSTGPNAGSCTWVTTTPCNRRQWPQVASGEV